MTKFWHSTCSKIPNNHNITHDDNKHQRSKALHYILVGNGSQSCCASNINCLSCSRKTKSTTFVTLFNINYSILGVCVLKYTKKLQKLRKMTKSIKTPKAVVSYWLGTAASRTVLAISSVFLSAGRLNQLNL